MGFDRFGNPLQADMANLGAPRFPAIRSTGCKHASTVTIMNTTMATLLREKGSVVYTIPADATAEAAVLEMVERRIGSLVVVAQSKLQGIFTEREALRQVVAAGPDAGKTPLSEVMYRKPAKLRARPRRLPRSRRTGRR